MNNIIARGAESYIKKIDDTTLEKQRDEKSYRHPHLDLKLRKFRTKREVKVLQKLKEAGLCVPNVYSQNSTNFTFEYLNGEVLKYCCSKKLLEKAFDQIISMHKQGVVHGDLTTLNMIVVDDLVYLIDFGLAQFSQDVEQRAVDLDLFFTCIENQHSKFIKYKKELLKEYEQEIGLDVIKRLEKIEQRGRNKNKK